MERVNLIIQNATYKQCLARIEELEKDRIYCKHDIEHFISVARIAYIMVLEGNIKIDREIIYAAALLHDIGKSLQYEKQIPHEEASADIAKVILKECNFTDNEIEAIISLILNHRNNNRISNQLEEIFYKSDKLSRLCYRCKGIDSCNWDTHQLNHTIKY